MENSQQQPASEPEEIRREIDETREKLGETVEALAQKTDVKAQAKKKASKAQEAVKATVAHVQEKVSEATPEQARGPVASAAERVRERPAVAAALAGGLVLLWLLARR
jgi:ElaB/YqjD/DUF883 family membrane-anchored ribosome-binding protein